MHIRMCIVHLDYQVCMCINTFRDVSKIETAIKSLSIKKKRPPPFRPPPYNPMSKTPPLPPKKKKTVSIQDISQPGKCMY